MAIDNKEEIIEEILRIEEFTCSYWYPRFEWAQLNYMDTPLATSIIWNIIKNRSACVEKLKRKLYEKNSCL